MIEHTKPKEWASNEDLPRGFTDWLKDVVLEFKVIGNLEFRQIGVELGVNPSFLSRWLGGKGPLTQMDIELLSTNLSPVVYTFLGQRRTEIEEGMTDEILESQ